MNRKNVFDFESPSGLKSIEITCTDITSIEGIYDILIVSAFQNDYKPLPKTLIGAINGLGINVDMLAQNPYLDMRSTQHVWLSKDVLQEDCKFKRIACVELSPQKGINIKMSHVKKRVSSLFGMLSAANYTGIQIKEVIMPIIGANAQDYSAERMAEIILREGYHALESIPQFQRLKVVEMNPERFDALSLAFNQILGRDESDIVSDVLYESTKKMVRQMKQDFTYLKSMNAIKLDKYNFDMVSTSFESIESDPRYMVAFKCRRLAEIAAIDILNMNNLPTGGNLQQKIERVCSACKLAGWLKFYWHTMRELGNEGVHIKDQIEKRMKTIKYHHPNSNDINILLMCSSEVLHTWRTLREKA